MKIALMIAGILLAVGLILGMVGLASNGFDFKEMNTMNTVENTYTITQPFSHVAIDSSVGAVELRPAADGICRLVCEETEKFYFVSGVEGDTLCVQLVNDMKWYEFMSFRATDVSAILYLPEATYASLHIKNKTGSTTVAGGFTFDSAKAVSTTGSLRFSCNVQKDLDLEANTGSLTVENVIVGGNFTLNSNTGSVTLDTLTVDGALALDTTSGSVRMNAVTCKTLDVEYSTSGVTLTDVVASETMEIEGNTGALRFTRIDAPRIEIETSTGSVHGTLRGEKIVYAHSSTGSIDIPRGTQGGVCEIETSTGGIKVEFE